MKRYLKIDPWKIVEDRFDPDNNRISESLFSLGNGKMGQRANFEEQYSGDTLQGNYIAGVYYPDKTKVGWWKNGYPEYFAKVINAPDWIGLNIYINDQPLDLAKCEVLGFTRILNMKDGYLGRNFRIKMAGEEIIEVEVIRFVSIVDTEVGAICYRLIPVNCNGTIHITSGIDADVCNEDANYNDKFWDEVDKSFLDHSAMLIAKTKKLDFHVATGIHMKIFRNENECQLKLKEEEKDKYIAYSTTLEFKQDDSIAIFKYAAVLTSMNYKKKELGEKVWPVLSAAVNKGFETLKSEQSAAWNEKWQNSDIVIEGDHAAQQGIRFNIFQLNQTYTGEDERLNIGPKGFTGEKYGGSTYWDTEAYCLPFYLCIADQQVARNLLIYRYKHLDKAIENAAKLGFKDGAALYPMVTMNGEECHNEWEITFEEIHRNGAMAFAIYNYIRYTGDKDYLADYGLEVLIAISRFWSQRITFSERKKQFVMLGVTGPNEYENNVNNNWYTNTLAVWTLKYTLEALDYVVKSHPDTFQSLAKKIAFNEKETSRWKEIIANLYLPESKELGIFLQQEDYLDKEQILARDLDPAERPINQNWSWDRILRSCFIKQADVLQGIYLFEEDYDMETIRRNYDFYESRTVHESSLSPCIHSILASKLGDKRKAYDLYLRTARLDLDDYNNEADQGCHITSMAGTWMAIVEGFGGKRVINGKISFSPIIPDEWKRYSFMIRYRCCTLKVSVDKKMVRIKNLSGSKLKLYLYNRELEIDGNQELINSIGDR